MLTRPSQQLVLVFMAAFAMAIICASPIDKQGDEQQELLQGYGKRSLCNTFGACGSARSLASKDAYKRRQQPQSNGLQLFGPNIGSDVPTAITKPISQQQQPQVPDFMTLLMVPQIQPKNINIWPGAMVAKFGETTTGWGRRAFIMAR